MFPNELSPLTKSATPKVQKRMTPRPLDPSVDYDAIALGLMRQLRGGFSQRKMSHDLGFTFNKVGKWENGATEISWSDFESVARLRKIDLEEHFRFFFWTFVCEFTAANIATHLMHDESVRKRFAGVNEATVRRWKSGASEPSLADVLKMIDTNRAVLIGWLTRFCDCSKFPDLKPSYDLFCRQVDAIALDPLVLYVNAALKLDGYRARPRHDESYLALHSTCTIAELRKTLKTMLEYGLATLGPTHYLPAEHPLSFSYLRDAKVRSITAYATELVARRYSAMPQLHVAEKPVNMSVSSVRTEPMSVAASKRVSELVMKFHRDVGEVVRTDVGEKTNVQVVVLHSFASIANAPAVL